MEASVSARRHVRGYLTFVVAVLAATAWTTNVSQSQHNASGVTIQMGVGHFNSGAEAFRH